MQVLRGYFIGTVAIIRILRCLWSNAGWIEFPEKRQVGWMLSHHVDDVDGLLIFTFILDSSVVYVQVFSLLANEFLRRPSSNPGHIRERDHHALFSTYKNALSISFYQLTQRHIHHSTIQPTLPIPFAAALFVMTPSIAGRWVIVSSKLPIDIPGQANTSHKSTCFRSH